MSRKKEAAKGSVQLETLSVRGLVLTSSSKVDTTGIIEQKSMCNNVDVLCIQVISELAI